MASITFFVFLTLALSLTTIHARESQFFAKVSNNIPQESQPLNTNQNTNENTNEQDLKFVPQTRETTQGSGYGLFGHESGQLPPSATTTNNNLENNNNYLPSNLPENYNPVAYTTPIHSSTQDIPNEFRYEPEAYKADNNKYNSQNQEEFMQTNDDNTFNSQNQEEFMQTNDDNTFNSQNQEEFMQTNDANMYNTGKQEMGTNYANYEKQGMSDTRFLNNGKYYHGGQTFDGARFVETQESGNNMFTNQKQGVNGYNQEMYNSRNQGVGESKYTTTNNDNSYDRYNTNGRGGYNNVNSYNPERQGMSDTRFLENGKYFYDLNLENQNLNSRGVRNGYETYGSNDNSYDRYNTNANGGYQNQEFQVNHYGP